MHKHCNMGIPGQDEDRIVEVTGKAVVTGVWHSKDVVSFQFKLMYWVTGFAEKMLNVKGGEFKHIYIGVPPI